MITVSQLLAFDPASWQASAEWARGQAKVATEAQSELTAQAAQIDASWPDLVGGLASAAVRALAASQGELATGYEDGATVIEDAAGQTTDLRDQLKAKVAAVHGNPHLSGPDDQGVVRSTVPFVIVPIDKMVEFFECATLAKQLTIDVRDLLVQADGRDREATIALMALIGIEVPPSNDGPIDLSDDGIRLQADLNAQASYGDCVSLSTLIGIAHSDPDFVREHMKWDPSTGTYEVILYRDGKPVTVHVDPAKLPTEGSDQTGTGKPSWLSVYEQALEQEFGDIETGKTLDVPIERITGKDADGGDPLSPDEVREALDRHPPAVITAGTAGASEQPDDVDPAKRVVPSHAYSVKGVDADGKIVLQNPWGPNGGHLHGTYYPGEVHLTEAEFKKWFSGSAVVDP